MPIYPRNYLPTIHPGVRTAAALSLGADDTVVSTVGGPQFSLGYASSQKS